MASRCFLHSFDAWTHAAFLTFPERSRFDLRKAVEAVVPVLNQHTARPGLPRRGARNEESDMSQHNVIRSLSTAHTRLGAVAYAAAAFIAAGALATDTPCEERVASDCYYASIYPFNTITRLLVEETDGSLSGYGTGFLVSPHCALTNGHCLYKRSEERYFIKDIHLMPGACRSGSGYDNPFGEREAKYKRTNNKYADPSYESTTGVDYGALQFVCPFEEITTFMPLCFDYVSTWAHMAGYPTEETPDSALNRNQWIAYGDVNDVNSRTVFYDARSTGGASGSPVWNWRAGEALVEVFAINSTHTNECDGGGPRLMWQNEDLIRNWMRWEPTIGERMAAGCVQFGMLNFEQLVGFFTANPKKRLSAANAGVANPIVPPPTGPSRRKMQYIERGFYEWAEFDLQPGNPSSMKLVQLLVAPGQQLAGVIWQPGMNFSPNSATQGWLSVAKANALLSGSAGRAGPAVTGAFGVSVVAGELNLVQEPAVIGVDAPDQTEDGEAPAPLPCASDLDGDGMVAASDLAMVLGAWGACMQQCPADFDRDGMVGGPDLAQILSSWGPCGQ